MQKLLDDDDDPFDPRGGGGSSTTTPTPQAPSPPPPPPPPQPAAVITPVAPPPPPAPAQITTSTTTVVPPSSSPVATTVPRAMASLPPQPAAQPVPLISSQVAMGPNGVPLTPAEIQAQAAALAAKEKEIADREAALRQHEQAVLPPQADWPKCCPLIVHDIEKYVPTDRKKLLVRMCYHNWLFVFFSLLADILVALLGWVTTDVENGQERFGLSVAYWLFDSAAFWFLAYYMLYGTAVRKKRSWKYGYFGVSYGIQIVFMTFLVIGVAQSGGCGIVGAIQFFIYGYPFIGVLYLLMFAKNTAILVHSIIIWFKVRAFHKLTQLENPNMADDNPLEKAKRVAQIATLAGQLMSSSGGAGTAVRNAVRV